MLSISLCGACESIQQISLFFPCLGCNYPRPSASRIHPTRIKGELTHNREAREQDSNRYETEISSATRRLLASNRHCERFPKAIWKRGVKIFVTGLHVWRVLRPFQRVLGCAISLVTREGHGAQIYTRESFRSWRSFFSGVLPPFSPGLFQSW
jgi:hypothetical protein